MRNTFRSTASQLVTASLVACMCAAWPSALAQVAPRALDGGPNAGARQGGDAAHGIRVDRACNRLFDGRGENVLVRGAGGQAGASNTHDCRSDNTQRKLVEAKSQVKAVEPGLKAPPITAGPAQVDRPSARDRGANTPVAPHVSVGRLSATLVTGSTAMFLLHSSLWTYLLILGLPLWQHVDLLPIVDKATDDDSATDALPDPDAEQAVTRVLDAQGPRRGGGGGHG